MKTTCLSQALVPRWAVIYRWYVHVREPPNSSGLFLFLWFLYYFLIQNLWFKKKNEMLIIYSNYPLKIYEMMRVLLYFLRLQVSVLSPAEKCDSFLSGGELWVMHVFPVGALQWLCGSPQLLVFFSTPEPQTLSWTGSLFLSSCFVLLSLCSCGPLYGGCVSHLGLRYQLKCLLSQEAFPEHHVAGTLFSERFFVVMPHFVLRSSCELLGGRGHVQCLLLASAQLQFGMYSVLY